jgi:chlorophyll/bacteriochlorophyll a synthase
MAGGQMPTPRSMALAALYSLGAHGIMTLNDFKAVAGDRRMGIRSLPVRLGVERAAQVASLTMAAPQFVVAGLLWSWGHPSHAMAIVGLLAVQLWMMSRFVQAPVERALWYSGFGVPLFVSGMMVSAAAIGHAAGAGG